MKVHNVTLGQFVKIVGQLPTEIEGAVVRGLRSAAMRGVSIVVEEIEFAQPYPAVDTGALRGSVDYQPLQKGGRIAVDAPHAAIIEEGSRPHSPPVAPLQEWAKRKFGVSDKEAKQIAFAVRKRIKESGTKPRRYMAKAVDRIVRFVPSEVSQELAKL